MPKSRDFVEKRKLTIYLLVIIAAFIMFDLAGRNPKVSIKPVAESQMTEIENLAKENHNLQRRLAGIEPASPVKIVGSSPVKELNTAQAVITVVSEGMSVPFETVYNDPDWVRPDYQPYWHSSSERSLSIPDLINNAHHRLFVTAGNSVLWDETARNSGISEIAERLKLPEYGEQPGDVIAIVTFNHQVADIFILNDQVVLMGSPTRKGLQILTLNKQDLFILADKKTKGQFLFQLVTPDGYEIDWRNLMAGS